MTVAGSVIAGNLLLGLGPADGEIKNLDVTPSFIGADLSFEHTLDNSVTGHYYALYVNGELRKLLSSTEQIGLDVLDDGANRVDVLIIRPETQNIPTRLGYEYGDRSFVFWDASASEDAVAYEVWQKASGAAEFSLAATLDRIALHPRIAALPDSGSGMGRVTVEGEWTGTETNQLANVEVQVSGGTVAFRTDLGGSWSVWRQVAEGGSYTLDNGLRIVFLSALATYADGDAWSFRVGPLTHWLSSALADETYQYKVRALDAAGNASDFNAAGSNTIEAEPLSVENAEASWNGAAINLAWTLPADTLSAIYVYSNYNNATRQLEDYVIEDAPAFTLAADAESLEIFPQSLLGFFEGYGYGYGTGLDYFDVFNLSGTGYGYGTEEFESANPASYGYGYGFEQYPSGTWLFYVRTVDASGIINQNVEMLRVDTGDMITGINLNEPENVTVEALPAGGARITWYYNWTDGEDATGFRIYYAASEFALSYSLDFGAYYAEDAVSGDDGYAQYSYDIESDLTSSGPQAFFVVRSATASAESTNRNVFAVTLDNVEPELGGATTAFSD